MKKKCRKCNKILAVPSWVICDRCSGKHKEPAPSVKFNSINRMQKNENSILKNTDSAIYIYDEETMMIVGHKVDKYIDNIHN